jgi:hypothetical protein
MTKKQLLALLEPYPDETEILIDAREYYDWLKPDELQEVRYVPDSGYVFDSDISEEEIVEDYGWGPEFYQKLKSQPISVAIRVQNPM